MVDVLDPEPGYYNSSTYYGTKDVLAFGAVLHHKPNQSSFPEQRPDFFVEETLGERAKRRGKFADGWARDGS